MSQQGMNLLRPAGMTRPEVKKPIRTSSQVVRQLFTILDSRPRSYKAVFEEAGVSEVTTHNWKSGRTMPRLSDFENVLQVLGYRIRLEKVEP